MVYNKSNYDSPNISPLAPKKWHGDNGVHAHRCGDDNILRKRLQTKHLRHSGPFGFLIFLSGRRAEEVYQGNCRRILQAIELSSDTCPSPMIQLKLSGLLPARLLVRVGDLYTASMDSRLKTVEAIADQMVKDSNQVSAFQDNLDRAELDTLGKAVRRLKDICEVSINSFHASLRVTEQILTCRYYFAESSL
ncbi:UNVERIFIED_CONTAM: hypothetical protein NCL1_27464 [Trichonephila clavipes]